MMKLQLVPSRFVYSLYSLDGQNGISAPGDKKKTALQAQGVKPFPLKNYDLYGREVPMSTRREHGRIVSIVSGSFDLRADRARPFNDFLPFLKRDLLAENTAFYVVGTINDICACFFQNVFDDLLTAAAVFTVYKQNYILRTVRIQLLAEPSDFIRRITGAKGQCENHKPFLICRICRRNIVDETSECFADRGSVGDELSFFGGIHNTHFHNNRTSRSNLDWL